MSCLKLSNKFDQIIYTSQMPIITDVKSVFSHTEGHLTGVIRISNTKVQVTNIQGLWRINK
jgi:hypothetical protein